MGRNRISFYRTALILALALFVAGVAWRAHRRQNSAPEMTQAVLMNQGGEMNAPEFPRELEWLNTNRPLSLRDLRGKIVLLDFWTYCCIDCMHIIPDLKRLEKRYADELVVIGVHSAKFTTERETANIRQAIARYEIVHPVVNDREMVAWQQYAVRAWPTLVLIDPTGKIIHTMSGGAIFEPLDRLISEAVEEFASSGQLNRKPLDLGPVAAVSPESPLAFPGKVLADEASQRLFIADSNHNRIVVVSLADNSVKEVIGTGETGRKDGGFQEAAFNHPQGMALDGDTLYLADTENHAIRAIVFKARKVATIAGTGEQAWERNIAGPGRSTRLSSPWDLVAHEGALYIAMAGPHQIWKLDLKTGYVQPFAGTSREARIDGPLAHAALAQPSGITTDGKKLYFADSEDSSIRSADLDAAGEVETIAGGDLFDYGDVDGAGRQARFQHPLGIVYHEGVLYVADTYNNKIKRVSPKDRTAETFLGTGKAGRQDGETATFYEPGGLAVANGKIYIADTNNHLIRAADLKTRLVETLQITGLEKPTIRKPEEKRILLPAQSVAPGEATLEISLELPARYKLNEEAPTAVRVVSSDEKVISFGGAGEQRIARPKFPISAKIEVAEGQAEISAEFLIYYCGEGKGSLCYFHEAPLTLPVKVEKGERNSRLRIAFKVSAGS